MEALDKNWHLAENELEANVTEFELNLWRVFYGFIRWQEDCEKTANETDLTGNDLALLHVIRMNDKPKSLFDIAKILNRGDSFNIQYTIRKLIKNGLIEKAKPSKVHKKIICYKVTEKGRKNTDTYTLLRKATLIEIYKKRSKDLEIGRMMETFTQLVSIYDEADRAVTTYVPSENKE